VTVAPGCQNIHRHSLCRSTRSSRAPILERITHFPATAARPEPTQHAINRNNGRAAAAVCTYITYTYLITDNRDKLSCDSRNVVFTLVTTGNYNHWITEHTNTRVHYPCVCMYVCAHTRARARIHTTQTHTHTNTHTHTHTHILFEICYRWLPMVLH